MRRADIWRGRGCRTLRPVTHADESECARSSLARRPAGRQDVVSSGTWSPPQPAATSTTRTNSQHTAILPARTHFPDGTEAERLVVREVEVRFREASVAERYDFRPPYPAEVFDILSSLLDDGPRTVLDAGCGTGDLARPLAPLVDRLDAVDQSAAMLAQARALPGGRAAWESDVDREPDRDGDPPSGLTVSCARVRASTGSTGSSLSPASPRCSCRAECSRSRIAIGSALPSSRRGSLRSTAAMLRRRTSLEAIAVDELHRRGQVRAARDAHHGIPSPGGRLATSWSAATIRRAAS